MEEKGFLRLEGLLYWIKGHLGGSLKTVQAELKAQLFEMLRCLRKSKHMILSGTNSLFVWLITKPTAKKREDRNLQSHIPVLDIPFTNPG